MAAFSWLNMLNGKPFYIIMEERDYKLRADAEISAAIEYCLNYASDSGVERLHVTIKEKSPNYAALKQLLKNKKFSLRTKSVLYTRKLTEHMAADSPFEAAGLDNLSEKEFMLIWERSMLHSLNSASSLSIDQQFLAMKQELGENYHQSCIVVYDKKTPIGVIMPHIEPGTVDEGRLFYFGLVPEYRGRGYADAVHRMGLTALQQMGATYYIGSTDQRNIPMIKVFEKNKCTELDKEEQYVISL